MKKLLLITALLFSFTLGFSQTVNPKTEKVHTYTKKNGTHVNSHYRTAPNHTTKDNYSHKGNTNPHTGKVGHSKK